VAVSPFQRIAMPRVERERIVPLTVDQVAAVVDVIGAQYKAMVVAQAGLGLRIGELLALRVQDVDFLRRTIRVEDQIERGTSERVPPKTPRSRLRTLPPWLLTSARTRQRPTGCCSTPATDFRSRTTGTRTGCSRWPRPGPVCRTARRRTAPATTSHRFFWRPDSLSSRWRSCSAMRTRRWC
jgi:integrase